MKKIFTILLMHSLYIPLKAQQAFSLSTDISLLRNLSTNQKFTTVGQTIQANFHFTKKESVYTWLSYYVNGKYKNKLMATAKDPFTGPPDQGYISASKVGYSQVSIGWKHYLRGSYNNEESYNLYGTAGFGLLTGRVENIFDRSIDTSVYVIPQQAIAGTKKFRRLTFDVALGAETNLATGLYLYAEVKTWLQASDYLSPFLYNNAVPKVVLLNGGIRILFD